MQLDSFKIVDLTHPLSPTIPTWNGSCGYCLEVKQDYDRIFCVQQMKMHAGIGTHMDAPSHRIQGAACIADIPLEQLILPACVIDVSARAWADYEISVEDIQRYEADYGIISKGALVIGYTGWSRHWMMPDAYRNVDVRGQMHFPAFSAKAAEFLLDRDVSGVGIDTLSPDCLDATFPVHKLILGANKYIIENIADCSALPPKGAYAIALPLRAEKATESPLRLIALISK